MCGIVGYFGKETGVPPAADLLNGMVDAVVHRGPDDRGILVDGPVGLGHARLSIIDVAGGSQPMSNAARTVHVAFNGEIFNYVELRRDLAERGHQFRTHSDTEVLLTAYEAFGVDCLARLNGDFACAIWDNRNGRLLLARDRMGVRPLHYAWHGKRLYFASEIAALLAVPGLDTELDPIALDQIFTFWCPLPPRTAFRGICQLPPGHALIVTAEGTTIRQFWQLDYPDAGDPAALNRAGEAAIAEELRALLVDATRIRLRSDVPVGAYLSGGLDSSIVAATVKHLQPDRLRTFSVTFDLAEFDESAFQQQMVAALGTQHTSIHCSAADIGRTFPDVVRHTAQPILRTAPVPLYRLARSVHEAGYKVVLTGEGADEVFGGYDIFKEAKIRRYAAERPDSARRPLLLQRLYPYLSSLNGQGQSYRAAFFAAGADDLTDPLFSHLPRFRSTIGAKAFYSAELREELAGYDALDDLRASLPTGFSRWHPLSQAQYLETAHLLPDYILSAQGDRVSMAHAVEGRFPFLDHRVVEFAASIPPNLKLRTLREKHILREAMKDWLPPAMANRVKQPYRAPESQSFAGAAVEEQVDDALAASALAAAGAFEPRAVGRLRAKCLANRASGFRDNAAFVGILSTQIWHAQFVRRTSPSLSINAPIAPTEVDHVPAH